MATQDLLTLLLEIVTVAFAFVVAMDFVAGLSRLGLPDYPQKIDALAITTLEFHLEPEPELAPAIVETETLMLPLFESESKPAIEISSAQSREQSLAQSESQPGAVLPVLLELATSVKLRPARKIAKLLGISQNVPLAALRANIKAKLQQPQLSPDVLEAMHSLLV